MKIRLPKSIASTLLVWFLFIAIIPLLGVSWYAYNNAVSDIETMQHHKLEDTSLANVEFINGWFDQTHKNLDMWSQNEPTQQYLAILEKEWKQSGKTLHDFTSSREYQKLLEIHDDHLVRISERYDYVYDLFLIDLKGNILSTVAKESDLGTNLINGPYQNTRFAQAYRATIWDKKAHFSDLEYYAPSNGVIAGFICLPMRGAAGEVVGIMALQLQLDTMVRKFSSSSSSMRHYLVGYEGLLRTPIASKSEILKRRVGSKQFWMWYQEHGLFTAHPHDKEENAFVYQGPDGHKVLGQHHAIEFLGVNWVQITEVDERILHEAPNALAQKIAFIMGLSIMIIVMLSVFIARRIVKPIKVLSEASEKYLSGIKGIQVHIESGDEIGEFGSVFNALIQKQEYDAEKLEYLAKKAQKTLDELKEQKYALDAHSIVAITDVKGTITFVNSKFEEITGYVRDELIGQNHRLLNSGTHSEEFWREMYHTVSHGEIWRGEVCNLAKDGHLYWVDTTIVPFLGEDGKPVSYIAIRTDISARKNAEIVIAEKEGSLQTLLDSVAEGIYGVDVHGYCTFANRSFLRILGFDHEQEVLGKHIHELIHHSHEDGSVYPSKECKMYKANQTHQPSHVEDEVFWKRDGTSIAVEYWSYPMMRDGEFIGAVATFLDITERKRTQDTLNEALQLQRAVFQNAGVSIITTDTQGLITSFNDAAEKMTGYCADEMVGKQTPALIHKIDEVVARAQELSGELGEVVEPGFGVFVAKADYNLFNTYEWTYVRKDGSELPVYLNVTALQDVDGKTNGYVGIASDVSLFKEAEAQMVQAKEAAESSARVKSEFLATMSHEIRTPMNGVLGMLGLLSHSNLDETQRHQIRVASNSANSLLGLINDILDFSKVEAGKMELELIEFNLRDELGEFVEAIAFRAQEKGLELILDTTHLTRTSVITDPGRLRQILTNLIGNAVKFTHRGEILITVMLDEVEEHNGRLRIDIRDSGIGIAPDKIDGLFQSFSQADNSTTRKYGGTGLGLAIVKKLCELMNGTVWITSVEYEGSTFHVDIGVGLGERSELSIPSVSVEGKSVLVVDDNETNRAVVRAQLEQWGMVVYEAEDSIVAYDDCQVRLSKGHIPPYDVALLDMQMPNMDGADLGSEIRNIAQCDGMKLVMMTSLGHRNDAARFADIGFDAFFAKPTTTKDLLNALKVLFDEGAARQGANPLVTKDYLGTLQEESSEVIWPSNTRVLLVEDNPTNQIVAQGMLDMIGLEADIANNGLEALEAMQLALDTAPYTIILMDCQMPEMDGYAASTAIREGRAGDVYKEIPIVAMTANAMAGDREKCLMSGMSDYVTKPINLATLKTALIKWMDGKMSSVPVAPHVSDARETKGEEEMQALKVWDEADALKRLGGKKELLHKIMQSFLDEGVRMMGALHEAIMAGDLPNVQLHSHSIKGSSGNVSGQQVNALAKVIEFAAKNGDKSVMQEGYKTLSNAMDELCAVFKKELAKNAQPEKRKKRLDPLQMAIKLQNLKKELQAGAFIDTDAIGIFGEYADETFTAHINALKGHIERFDTVQALEELEAIMAGLE